MSIVGGAVIPLDLGFVSDASGHLQCGYLVLTICFIVVPVLAMNNRQKVELK